MWPLFPLIKQFLAGIAASSLNEARLGKEEFGGEIYVYAPAYSDEDFNEIVKLAKNKPEKLELIFTGRFAHVEIQRIADYVTEMLEIKHPYQQGIEARKGIDF